MTAPPNRRKVRLVDRRFQLGLAWRMLLVFLLFFASGLVLVFAPSMLGLLTGVDLAELEPAAQEFLILHQRVWPAVLLVLAGVFLYTLITSHRIAGPIYRINTVLRMMLEDEYPTSVTLRKGDHLHETAELLELLSRKLSRGRSEGTSDQPGKSSDPGPAG